MNDLLIFLLLLFLSFLIFILLHLRPLTSEQVGQLATKLRKSEIKKYLNFDNREYIPNKKFKSNMKPNGSFYNIDDPLYEIPSISASLLKYKKHEWIILAFEKNKKINMIWVNKGNDNSSVSFTFDFNYFVKIAKENNYTSLLIFHNHPNSKPKEYDKTSPSESDISSAKEFAKMLRSRSINLIEFVCERGNHYIYYRSINDSFLSIENFIEKICEKNNESRMKNLSLHIQRIFKQSNDSYVINGKC